MHISIRFILCFITVASLYRIPCDGQTIHNASNLIDDLLTNYKTVLRPVINQSESLHVDCSMGLLSILEFDEVKGILKINAYLALSWTDQILTWNTTSYNGLEIMTVESSKVWTPMIVHLNTVDETEKIGSDDPWQLIRFDSNGRSLYYPGGLFSSSCTADVTHYPYDINICDIELLAWGFAPTEIQLRPSRNDVVTNFYSPNGVWNFKGSNVRTKEDNIKIAIQLIFERKPLFVFFNVILPIVFMTFLNIIVFLIPIESGERISYNITMLLAVAVFLTLVGDNLPKTSSPMSIFSFYLVAILALSVLFVIANVISLRCYFKSKEENINRYWLRLVKISKFDFLRKCKPKHKVHTDVDDINEKRGDSSICVENYEKTKPPMATPRETNQDNDLDETLSVSPVSWQEVSHAVDRISFVASLVSTILVSLIFSIVIYSGPKS